MIVVRLAGGLGNQMFQYAFGRRLALTHGVPLYLDVEAFAPGDKRTYRLDKLRIRAEVATPTDMRGLRPRSIRLARRWQRLFGRSKRLVCERGFRFDPRVLDGPPDAYFDGYWQSERYFSTVRDALLEEFQPRLPLSEARRGVAQRIAETAAVSLHVRRGDYVSDARTSARHGHCSAEWYREAMAAMAAVVEDPTFFVFSDDPAWARSNLATKWPTHFAEFGDDCDYEDLHLMSRCRHHIIANSSFSWWGAWLNPRLDKHVIAPKQWFRAPDIDTGDLVPTGWRRL